jgi:RHS repeat-associated protein
MTMTVSYLTIDGEIVSETRSGVRSDYIPDPLGSMAALINSSHTITDTFSWWPFGQLRSHVGSSTTPLGFIGTKGYYADSVGIRLYVIQRVFRPQTTAWQTVDPLWPSERPYCCTEGNPTSYTDPWGTQTIGLYCLPQRLKNEKDCEDTAALKYKAMKANCEKGYDSCIAECRETATYQQMQACEEACENNPKTGRQVCLARAKAALDKDTANCRAGGSPPLLQPPKGWHPPRRPHP